MQKEWKIIPHSIHVAFLRANAFAMSLVRAVTEKGVISSINMFISDKNGEYSEICAQFGYPTYDNDVSALIKAEVVVICVPKSSFSTVLAKISSMTRGKIILAISEGIDCTFVQNLTAKGTSVAAASPIWNDVDAWETTLMFSEGFPPYMKSACSDIVGSLCQIKQSM